ncbi:aminoacyl-tRNA hydrolase [candidate division KSB1 bacterium]|nr:aminoacyl-tRNA hydrolase [candidate division KSB1 bacterium]
MAQPISMIVFLGNPGTTYKNTRHNIAWLLEPHLSLSARASWQKKFKGQYSRIDVAGEPRILLKPETLMNRSGDSVQSASQFFKIPVESVLVVHDDLELPYGWIDCRLGGGLAGHNGLRSIAERLGSRDFVRFRLGISRPERGSVANYVLSTFGAAEKNQLDRFLDCAAQHLESCLQNASGTAFDAGKINCL